MTASLSPTQSRVLAILLAIAALLLAAAVAVLPALWLHKRYDDSIEQYAELLRHYRRIGATRPAIERAAGLAPAQAIGAYYLRGMTPTLAGAELQGLLTRTIDANQGRIMSSQILPNNDKPGADGLQKVVVSVQMGAATIPLQTILHAIEAHEPYLFIDQLTVRANQGRTARTQPEPSPEHLVQLTVHAYALAAGTKP